jgi:hypothetical protein
MRHTGRMNCGRKAALCHRQMLRRLVDTLRVRAHTVRTRVQLLFQKGCVPPLSKQEAAAWEALCRALSALSALHNVRLPEHVPSATAEKMPALRAGALSKHEAQAPQELGAGPRRWLQFQGIPSISARGRLCAGDARSSRSGSASRDRASRGSSGHLGGALGASHRVRSGGSPPFIHGTRDNRDGCKAPCRRDPALEADRPGAHRSCKLHDLDWSPLLGCEVDGCTEPLLQGLGHNMT